MNANILVELKKDDDTLSLSVPRGITVKEIADTYRSEDQMNPIFALENGLPRDLTHKIRHSCTLQLIDMRSRLARLAYQRTVYFIYKIALHELLPGNDSALRYPLNDGLLVDFEYPVENVSEAAYKIEKRMKEIIASKAVFDRRIISRSEILSADSPECITDKMTSLVETSDIQEVFEFSYEGFSTVFFDPIMRCSEYIDIFEIVPYNGNIIIRVPHFADPAGLRPYRDDKKLYKSFNDLVKWRNYIGVKYVGDLNRKILNGEWRDLILISEAQHEKKIARIADQIKRSGRRIVLIAGPSASGKTTFAQRLCIQLRVNGLKPLYMGTDDYFLERSEMIPDKNGKLNFEDLSAFDLKLFNEQMNDLLAGDKVDMPVFDFITGSKRYGTRITRAETDQPIVIEGIHALNPKLTEGIPESQKFRIYISPLTALNIDPNNRIPVTDLRLIRRMARDMRSRGRTAEQTLEQWNDVRRGEEKNIFPFNGEADVLFNSTVVYELAVLRPLVEDGLKAVQPGDLKYQDAQRLLRLLRCVTPLKDYSTINTNSIMREFIGGGIWVK
ncbi:MAG: nucleoside kinase [Anaerovoracaceae bacterium]|jgi:uridine kinase